MGEWILLVGGRSAAIKAARRLGLRTVVLAEEGVHRTVRRHADELHEIGFSGQTAVLELARSWRGTGPRAVVATTEESVLPAAWLRRELRLSGLFPEAAERFRNKHRMKNWFRKHGIPCARSAPITRQTRASGLIRELGLPMVLKARRGSGSRGTIVARNEEAVRRGLEAFVGVSAMAESFVPGREVSVESFVTLPTEGAGVPGEVIWTNVTSYEIQGQQSLLPAPDELPRRPELLELNARVITALGLDRGMTHLEAFCTDEGWVVGEIAARPPGGYLMELIQLAYEFDAWEAYLRLCLGERPALLQENQAVAAAHMLRPAMGRVVSVEGLEEARGLPGVVAVHCSVEPGDWIKPVESVSSASGRLLVRTTSAGETRQALARAIELVRIDIAG